MHGKIESEFELILYLIQVIDALKFNFYIVLYIVYPITSDYKIIFFQIFLIEIAFIRVNIIYVRNIARTYTIHVIYTIYTRYVQC